MKAPSDSAVMPETKHYLDQIARVSPTLPGKKISWLNAQRRRGLDYFKQNGFPSPRDEDWRYTPIRAITAKAFAQPDADIGTPDAEQFQIPGLDSFQIILVDGIVKTGVSHPELADKGVKVDSMASLLDNDPEALSEISGSLADERYHGFAALNFALYQDGVVIRIDPSVRLDKPIEIISVSQSALTLSSPRNLIYAGEGAKAQIIERYVSQQDAATLTNSITEIFADDGAEINHCLIQAQSLSAYHVCGLWVRQAARSRVSCQSVAYGGALIRNDLNIRLQGAEAHCDMLGVYSLTGRQHIDNHTTVIHQVENCSSKELYKGVLDQRARGVFHGRIKVDPGAQKTDAEQSNATLLLSKDAEIDTKPQLEIYADDVKCSHGATIGQIDNDALFYLRSRGIGEDEARALLTFAFLSGVVKEIDIEPLQVFLERQFVSRLL